MDLITIQAGSIVRWTGVSGSTVDLPLGIDLTLKELGEYIGAYDWQDDTPVEGTLQIIPPREEETC